MDLELLTSGVILVCFWFLYEWWKEVASSKLHYIQIDF